MDGLPQKQKTTVYLVWCITYVDDYKLRGECPSEMEGPVPFLTKEGADAWLCKSYVYYLENNTDNADAESIREHGLEPYFTVEQGYGKLSVDFVDNIAVLEQIIEALVPTGEFIPCKPIEWGYSEHELE